MILQWTCSMIGAAVDSAISNALRGEHDSKAWPEFGYGVLRAPTLSS
jgi:hypothetical protein